MIVAAILGHVPGLSLTIGTLIGGNNDSTASSNAQLIVLLLAVTLVVALISRSLRLPYTLILVIAGLLIGFSPVLNQVVLNPDIVLFLFLPVLLFEGAWNVEIEKLAADWLPIFLLAGPGLLLAVGVLAVVLHLSLGMPWLVAIMLGAIVSPTDPVAALSLLKQLGLPERLYVVIEGESLFNDGVGVAVFGVVFDILLPSLGMAALTGELGHVSGPMLTLESLWLLVGGPLLGLLIGWIVAGFLLLVDAHLIETTVTFSVAYGSYLIGNALHTSGLLTVVGAGLIIGSYGRNRRMSQRAQEAAQDVWEFTAYLANSLLFLLLGIQIGASKFFHALPGILWAVLGIIVGRFLMIYLLIPLHNVVARRLARRPAQRKRLVPEPRPLPSRWRPVLVLVGLRGALSIALVLSLPRNFIAREQLENIVYGVVLITLLGQGLGLRFLLPHWPSGEDQSKQETTISP